jgi:hypothetical protein
MKWRALVAGVIAPVVMTMFMSTLLTSSSASAEVRIVGDPGGEVSAYLQKYREIRDSGQRVVIDGACLSACTLLTAIIPPDRVCVTQRAMLGFHAASYYDDTSRTFVPTRAGSRVVMSYYPPAIRRWIDRHGGLTPHIIQLRGRELSAMYRPCE